MAFNKKNAKRQEQNYTDVVKQASDPVMIYALTLGDRELKIIIINMLRALMKKCTVYKMYDKRIMNQMEMLEINSTTMNNMFDSLIS